MTSCDLFVTANDGPLSSVFFHFTSIMRALPLASQGLAKEPGPVAPGGQSWGGSGAADARGAAPAAGAGAGADASGAALADAVVAGALSSLKQAASSSIAAAG